MKEELYSVGGLILPKKVDLGGSLWARYGIVVADRDGKILDERGGPCKSFLRNFGRAIRGILSVPNTTQEVLTKTDNTTFSAAIQRADAVAGTEGVIATTGKIKLGSSNAAVLSTQYELQGTILKSGTLTSVTTLIENTVSYSWRDEYSNLNSGASYDVYEMGLYAMMRSATVAGQSFEVMFMRDIVSPFVTVPNGSTVYARYDFTVAI